MYINTCKRYDKIWSWVLESDDSRRNRDVKSFYRNEKHRAGASSKLYRNGAHLSFPPDLHREISPPRGLWWSLRRPERTGAKRVADRGNIGSPHWITSGEAIFRKSESNVTWRGESEGIDVETVMSNRYFYKYPRETSEKRFGTQASCAARSRNCIKFHKLFRCRDSKVKALKWRGHDKAGGPNMTNDDSSISTELVNAIIIMYARASLANK